ncbi:hypothetical protein [Micromonospora marina]|uniref:hypothetical protein n=1 Tax=Micromonospora marina TaxID=307120 RepID=UPI003D749B03
MRTLQTNARETGKYIGYRRLLGLASGAGITERQLGDGLGWLCNFGALRHRPVPGKGTRYKIEEEVEWS